MRIEGWLTVMALVGMTGAPACGEGFETAADGSGASGGGGGLAEGESVSGLALINPACGVGSGTTVSQACVDCTTEHCASEMSDCFGSSWQTDLQAGTCSDFGTCVTACDCGEPDCFKVCLQQLDSNTADPCRACVVDLVDCERTHCDIECEISDDPGHGGSGSGGSPGKN